MRALVRALEVKNTAALLAAVFFFLSPFHNLARSQAVVRDSERVVSSTPQAQPTTDPVVVESDVSSRNSTNLAYQIQQLQQEVLELRGLLEEQAFELKRLKKQRLDDYLDLDKRLAELAENGNPVSDSAPPGDSALLQSGQSDKELYRQGIDLLLNRQDYAGAKQKFGEYLKNYPDGLYVPNVYYWQGQILLAEGNPKVAETNFKSLLDRYPDHQKAPDAKYKLATIYFDEGKRAEAKSLLEEVANSESDVARLAKSFLSNQFN